jgi:Fe-S cluster assembly protein SufD
MNMHVPRIMTAGETALLALMERVAAEGSSGETARLREEAAGMLRTEGLPSRKIEAWHYTDLRSLFRAIPPAAAALSGGSALVPGSVVMGAGAMPHGVTMRTLDGAIAAGSEPGLLGEPRSTDVIGIVSAGLATGGHEINIGAGVALAAPLELPAAAGHRINRIDVGANAKAVIVERAAGSGLSSVVTKLTVGDNAQAVHVIDQATDDGALHFARLSVTIGAGASLVVVLLNAGGALSRREIDVVLAGEGGDFKLRGMNLLSGSRHADVTMTVRHVVENTTSTEFMRNVVTGAGKGVFQGQIRVAPEAQKTDARMACNTLLLSDDGEFLAKPELEIFADDVACGHGATVAEINRDHLFYLMARGVPEAEARALLVKAFVAELVDEIEDEALHDALYDRLSAWLATH